MHKKCMNFSATLHMGPLLLFVGEVTLGTLASCPGILYIVARVPYKSYLLPNPLPVSD